MNALAAEPAGPDPVAVGCAEMKRVRGGAGRARPGRGGVRRDDALAAEPAGPDLVAVGCAEMNALAAEPVEPDVFAVGCAEMNALAAEPAGPDLIAMGCAEMKALAAEPVEPDLVTVGCAKMKRARRWYTGNVGYIIWCGERRRVNGTGQTYNRWWSPDGVPKRDVGCWPHTTAGATHTPAQTG